LKSSIEKFAFLFLKFLPTDDQHSIFQKLINNQQFEKISTNISLRFSHQDVDIFYGSYCV